VFKKRKTLIFLPLHDFRKFCKIGKDKNFLSLLDFTKFYNSGKTGGRKNGVFSANISERIVVNVKKTRKNGSELERKTESSSHFEAAKE